MSDTTIVVNPATEAPIAELPLGGVGEADDAVARALAAGPAWRAVAPADRARLAATVRRPGGGARRGAGPAGDGQCGQGHRGQP